MKLCAERFVNLLREKDLNFSPVTTREGNDLIDFPWQGRNLKCIFSGDQGEYLSLYYFLESVPEDKIADALWVCNEMNNKYKWVKFYIDSENDIMLEDDAILTVENAPDEAFELILRMIDILKDSKPAFMRAIYS